MDRQVPQVVFGNRHSLSICAARGVGQEYGSDLPCSSSGCRAAHGGRRFKCVELSQAHVRSLGNLGTGILGNVVMSNGVKSPDSIFAATTSDSIENMSTVWNAWEKTPH